MNEVFGNIRVGRRFFLRNLVLYPLEYSASDGNGFSMLSLDEAIDSNVLFLRDVYGVDSIGISNNGNLPVLMLEGESLQGARQDRIINATSVLEPEVETRIPVSCVEQHRWRGSNHFSSSLTLAFPSLRSVLRKSVSSNLVARGSYASDQNAIWNEVKKTITVTKTKSMTLSMHDAYDALKDEIERYMEERGEIDGVYGYLVFAEDRFISLDIFASLELLRKYERKLFESYAMQGILFRLGQKDLKKVEISPEDIGVMDSLEYKLYEGSGASFEMRYNGDLLASVVFDSNKKFVYASVLPSPV